MGPRTRLVLLAGALAAVFATVAACGDDTSVSDSKGGDVPSATDGAPGSNQFSAQGDVAKPAIAPESTAATRSGAGAKAPVPDTTGGGQGLSTTLDRKIVFNSAIGLGVSDVAFAFNEASRIAVSNGGFVEKSQFYGDSAGAKQRGQATLTLRVPASKYQDVLAGLRGIKDAKVNTESARSAEVTEQYTDLQSRQRNLERTEGQYLKLLEQAKTIPEILTVNDRLDSVRGQIEQIQGRLKVLDQMTDLATIDVSLALAVPGKAPDSGGPKGIGEAFADAWEASLDALRYLANAGAVLAVAAIWLTVPALLILGGARFARRSKGAAA
jgi:hypothetical protein